jgi:hypothetical protein
VTEEPYRPGRIVVALAVICVCPVLAGGLEVFARMFEENRQRLREYAWTSRTEITLDGVRQMIEQFEVRFDEDGEQELTRVSVEPAETDGGPIRRRKNRKRRKQAEELHQNLRSLIESYVHPDPETTRQIFSDPFIWRGEGRVEGVTRVQARNVVREGDQVSLWLDAYTEEPTKLEILTSYEGEPVRMTTDFLRIENGPFYPSRVVVETEIREKKWVVTTVNSDYH